MATRSTTNSLEVALFRVYEKNVKLFEPQGLRPEANPNLRRRTPQVSATEAANDFDIELGVPQGPQTSIWSDRQNIMRWERCYQAEGFKRLRRMRFGEVAEAVLLFMGIFCMILLVILHSNFSGTSECIEKALLEQHRVLPTVVDRVAFERNVSAAGQNSTGKKLETQAHSVGLLSDSILRIQAFRHRPRWEFQLDSLIKDENAVNGYDTFDADFEFSCTPSSMRLNESLREIYGIQVLNVSLPDDCLGGWLPGWRRFINGVAGETIVVNQVMFAFQCNGFLRNANTKEVWVWRENDFDYLNEGWSGSLLRRSIAILKSIVGFAALTTCTALLIRVLLTSGVAIMFPVFDLLQAAGVRTYPRLLNLSYPWLGAQLDIARRTRRTTSINAHLVQVFIFYSMYDACQFTWGYLLYSTKPAPDGIAQTLFGLIMLAEYYSIIFLRSKLAILFFPRIFMAYFLLYHAYYFLNLYGFTQVAMICLYCSSLHAMFFCIRTFEVKSLNRGLVSIEHPRMLYNTIPCLSANQRFELPPLWSMFFSLNSAPNSIYDNTSAGPFGVDRFIDPSSERLNTVNDTSDLSHVDSEQSNTPAQDLPPLPSMSSGVARALIDMDTGPEQIQMSNFSSLENQSTSESESVPPRFGAPTAEELPRRVPPMPSSQGSALTQHVIQLPSRGSGSGRTMALRAAEARRRSNIESTASVAGQAAHNNDSDRDCDVSFNPLARSSNHSHQA